MNTILQAADGLEIAYQYNPNVRSVCWGVFVHVGSVDETEATSGISHLIEHMCFKGTTTRSAYDIVRESDDLGANLNAFTSKEQTAFYVQCVDDVVEPAVAILADIVLHSTFDPDELVREKEVVCEEIDMSEDTPDDLASDVAAAAFWGEDSLSRPILGTKANVQGFSQQDLLDHVRRYYVRDNVVLSVVGNISAEEVCRLADRYFVFPTGEVPARNLPMPRATRQLYRQKDVEQCNVILCYDGLPRGDDDAYALLVLDAVLGGGMSSILFQRVREQQGLAYSVYSYGSSYEGRGAYSIYLGTNPTKLAQALRTVADVIRELRRDGITPEQLERGRNQTLSAYVLGLESGLAAMRVGARRLQFEGKPLDLDAEIARLRAVDMPRIDALIERVFSTPPAVGLVARDHVDCMEYFNGKQ